VATPASKALAKSPHTLADLKRFAKAKPTQAGKYLTAVERKLRAAGKKRAADAVKKLLTDKTGSLVERLAHAGPRLGAVFPRRGSDWGKVQAERLDSVGYDQIKVKVEPQFVTGRVRIVKDTFHLVTANGQDLVLSQPSANRTGLSLEWLEGFIGDGPITVMGLISEDNKSFDVEGFALNRDGKYSTFTFGRVSQAQPWVITTSRGDVTIEDAKLLKKLKAMPRLGVILPGLPEKRGGALVYTGKPQELFGLARWKEDKAKGSGPRRRALADMAFSIFRDKPVELPATQAARVNHRGRLWVLGDVVLGPNGEATLFKASYVSKRTDTGTVFLQGNQPEADAVQGVVMTTDPSVDIV
jgi:hypothetical protein